MKDHFLFRPNPSSFYYDQDEKSEFASVSVGAWCLLCHFLSRRLKGLTCKWESRRTRAGGSVLRNLLGAADGALIRAVSSDVPPDRWR